MTVTATVIMFVCVYFPSLSLYNIDFSTVDKQNIFSFISVIITFSLPMR
jgi:hypothetical protein